MLPLRETQEMSAPLHIHCTVVLSGYGDKAAVSIREKLSAEILKLATQFKNSGLGF